MAINWSPALLPVCQDKCGREALSEVKADWVLFKRSTLLACPLPHDVTGAGHNSIQLTLPPCLAHMGWIKSRSVVALGAPMTSMDSRSSKLSTLCTFLGPPSLR